jgi:hypothetical protein
VAALESAKSREAFLTAEIASLGCLNGLAAVREYYPLPSVAEEARLKETCRNKLSRVEPEADPFQVGLTKGTSWARQQLLTDAQDIAFAKNNYARGYEYPFLVMAQYVSGSADTVARWSCEEVVRNGRPALSLTALETALDECAERARGVGPRFPSR